MIDVAEYTKHKKITRLYYVLPERKFGKNSGKILPHYFAYERVSWKDRPN